MNLKIRKVIFIFSVFFFFGVFGLAKNTWAATLTAASCNLTAVQAAVNNAARGDTINVPAGSCSWNAELAITKSISLIGAGAGRTVITSTQSEAGSCLTTSGADYCKYMIRYEPDSISGDANTLLRISGFTLDADYKVGHILIFNYSITPHTMVRIDSNNLADANYAANTSGSDTRSTVMIRGPVYGVMDGNSLSGAPIVRVYGTGQWMWQNMLWTPGTSQTFFFEDNTITYDYPSHTDWVRTLDSTGLGASWVIRYNDYIADPVSSALIMIWDSHPGYDEINTYATRGKEAYGNDFTGMGRFSPRCNGGQSIIYFNRDNDTSSTYVPTMVSQHDYANNDGLSTCGSNAIPSEVGRTSCNSESIPQYPYRNYEWANWWGSTPSTWTGYSSSGAISLRMNIDLFQYNRSFGERTAGNSTGCGCGTLANRPATCTTGTVYWATDQSCSSIANSVGVDPATPISGMLYRCTATDIWSVYYSPYTYPHPLRNLATGNTAPAVPTGVRVI